MERRHEARIQSQEDVQVTVLTNEPGTPITARAVDLSGRGLSLILGQPLPTGAAVRVDGRDRLFLGEVAYCVADGTAFRLGIEVSQSLRQTRDLVALRRALYAEASGNTDATMRETPHVPPTVRSETEAAANHESSTPQLEHARSYLRCR